MKKVSIKMIAQNAQVAASTASLILNHRGDELRIAKETQEKVLRVAKELGYEFSPRKKPAQSLATKQGKYLKVAIFFTNTEDFPIDYFNEGLLNFQRSSSHMVDWVYHAYEPNRLEYLSHLFTIDYCDGIIVTTPYDEDSAFLERTTFSIPVILYNYQINGYTSICHDDFENGKQTAATFCQHKRRRIAIITPAQCSRAISLRVAGVRNYLESIHFPDKDFMIISGSRKNAASGYEAISNMLDGGFFPSAIYVINDLMITGVVQRLLQEHFRIPEDIEIISYGNKDAPYLHPSISSYDYVSDKMAAACMKNLIQEIIGEAQRGRYYSFRSVCIWRESCQQ